jgi:hypothetical protein
MASAGGEYAVAFASATLCDVGVPGASEVKCTVREMVAMSSLRTEEYVAYTNKAFGRLCSSVLRGKQWYEETRRIR